MKKKSKEETARFVGALLLVLFLIALVTTISVTQGAIHVSPDEIVKIVLNRASGKELFVVTWEQKTENIIWNIRFPRVLTSCASYWIFKILFKKLIVDTKQEDEDHDQGQSIGQITAHPVVDF